jgi:hypothetical protein
MVGQDWSEVPRQVTRGGGGWVRLRFEPDADGAGELHVDARTGGYAGRSSAWFTVDEVRSFADALSSYRLDQDASVRLAGGYWSHDGTTLDQEHVGIAVDPVGSLGQLVAMVHLADPVDGGVGGSEARVRVPTTHQRVREFGDELALVLRKESEEAVLREEVMA